MLVGYLEALSGKANAHKPFSVEMLQAMDILTQLALLQTRNCDFIQGFYFSKPLVAEQAMAFFQQHFDNLPQAS